MSASPATTEPMAIPADELLKLDNQLCFPLYAASKEVVRRYTPLLDELGLTYTQYIAMMVLWEKHEVTAHELGERLYLDSGTLTPMLRKLEDKGLVSRERSAEDARQLMVSLTPAGEALKQRAAQVPLAIGGCIDLSLEEAIQLRQLLDKVLRNVHEH